MLNGYICEYCDLFARSKDFMTQHEKNCDNNPAAKCCATCKHLSFKDLGDDTQPLCRVKNKEFAKTEWMKNCDDWVVFK